MRRRAFLGRAAGTLFVPLAAACAEADDRSAPARVRHDRDTCERCRMLISDPRFAAQARVAGVRDAYKYDDIGCAVIHLKHLGKDTDVSTRIWVADVASAADRVVWHDARSARYLPGRSSPMGYDHAAVAEARPGTVDFDALRAAVLEKEARR